MKKKVRKEEAQTDSYTKARITEVESAALDAEMAVLDAAPVEIPRAFSQDMPILDFIVAFNNNTVARFSGMWRANASRNWPRARNLPGISALQKTLSSVPVVILAAGPSLEENCAHLKDIQNRFAVICTGHAYERALACGIEPDLVVAVDAQPAVLPQLECHRPGDLVAMPMFLAPAVFNSIQNADLVMFDCGGQAKGFTDWMRTALWGDRENWHGMIDPGGCVTASAAALAIVFGASHIIFMGLDLCLYDRPEDGTTGRYETNTVRGEHAWTFHNYFFQKRWLEDIFMPGAHQMGVTVVNATGNGILEGDCIHTTGAGAARYALGEDRDYAARMRERLAAWRAPDEQTEED